MYLRDDTRSDKALKEFFVGQTNKIYERYTLNQRDKEQTKTIIAYIAVLRTLVNDLYLEQYLRITKNQNFARTFKTEKTKQKKHVHEDYTDTFDSEDTSLVVFVLSVQHVNEVASRKIRA